MAENHIEDPNDAASGQYESKAQTSQSPGEVVAGWIAQWDLASKTEQPWRDEHEKAREIYRAEKSGAKQRFNILYSNIQTLVPALYNSTPTPDVRTRYNDENELSRLTSQAVERILSYSVDAYSFDGTMKAAVQDRE